MAWWAALSKNHGHSLSGLWGPAAPLAPLTKQGEPRGHGGAQGTVPLTRLRPSKEDLLRPLGLSWTPDPSHPFQHPRPRAWTELLVLCREIIQREIWEAQSIEWAEAAGAEPGRGSESIHPSEGKSHSVHPT